MNYFGRIILITGLFLFLPIQAEEPEKYVQVSLISDVTTVTSGQTITVGIVQDIYPKWHVYWINPGDSGEAPQVEWSGVTGLTVGRLQWPLPKRIPYGPLTNIGYEDQVILLQEITLPTDLPQGAFELVADLSVLVCEEICIPEFHTASLTLNGAEKAAPSRIDAARNLLPIELDWSANYSQHADAIELRVAYQKEKIPIEQFQSVELFFEEKGAIGNSANTISDFSDDVWILRHNPGDLDIQNIQASPVVITYNDPNGQTNAIRLQASLSSETHGMTQDVPEVSFITALGLALLGGLILNLMPCVFPILSLKALSLVHMKAASHKTAAWHGWAYTAGVMISFLLIAAGLIALKSVGSQIGWGFQLQNPLFVAFLIYLLMLIGLNLAGYFELSGRFGNLGASLASHEGLKGSFFTGVLATLVATPCTAPFMGVAMGYALTQSAAVSLSVFAALGLGLALPYLILALVPASRRLLPQPGTWMVKFKEFLAFPMFATVVWLVWVLSLQAGEISVLWILMGLVVLSLAIWMLRTAANNTWTRWLAVVVFAVSLLPFYQLQQTSNTLPNDNWQPYTQAAYDEALNNPEPVFINMTAAWCITCQVNEQIALDTDTIKELFIENEVQYLKGDWTNFDAQITQYLEKYKRSGVPIYVYYGAKDSTTGVRPQPQVLPQLLTPAIIQQTVAPLSE